MKLIITRFLLLGMLLLPGTRAADESVLEILLVLDAQNDGDSAHFEPFREGIAKRFENAGHSVAVSMREINFGDSATHWQDWLSDEIGSNPPDVVIFQPGGYPTSPQTADALGRENIDRLTNLWTTLVKTAKDLKVKVAMVTPVPILTNTREASLGTMERDKTAPSEFLESQAEYARSVRDLSFDQQILLIDVDSVFREYDAVPGQSIFTLMPDGFKPGGTGQALMAEHAATSLMTEFHWRPQDYSTIPQYDLDRDTFRQVIVDREEGQYLGHPTTVLLEDGRTILAVYPKGHGSGGIVYKKSFDGGLSWSERLPVPENWSSSAEVPTIYRTIDRSGMKRLIMFSGLYPIRMARSEDDGMQWSPLEPIGEFGGIVAMASLARSKDGRYTAFFHDDGRFISGSGFTSDGFFVYQTHSDDGGLTWGAPTVIASHPTAHLCEPGLVVSPDGSEWALLLRENSRRLNSFVIFSQDEGESWSDPIELPASLTGDRHTAKYVPDGRLFISFRDTGHNSPTQGDWIAWVGAYEDIRQGNQGSFRLRLKDNKHAWDTAYPGVEVLPDGTIVTTTYGHWDDGEEPYILSVRLKLDEFDGLLNE